MIDLGNVHGTVVAWRGKGVMLCGPPGSGKSDLAIRLLAEGAVLVADDRVDLSVQRGRVVARTPETLAGKIEARGVGILKVGHQAQTPVSLVVHLRPRAEIERLPDLAGEQVGDLSLPSISLHAFDASAPAKIALVLRSIAL